MKKKVLYFVDEDAIERRSSGDVLVEIFDGSGIEVRSIAPLPILAEYANLVADGETAGFILDQRLGTAGAVSYTGIDLAQFLRGLETKIPILIFTNFSDDDFGGGAWAVEDVVPKDRIRDPASTHAKEFRARLLRHVDVFERISNDRARRHHELLVKSLHGPLSGDEDEELKLLQGSRMAAVASAELDKQRKLDDEIAYLKRLLGDTIG